MKVRFNKILEISAILLTIIVLASCSTKKNKWNRRFWHNMTSHYNVWWNGNQSLKEGEKTLQETVKDDYTKTLPVFNYGTKQDALGLYQNMDRTIEKDAICVQRHSMRFNNKEYVRWIDDAFIDMGKAQFYKQDYVPARRIFDYVATQYRTSPDRHTATLWLAKTYIATKQYEKAEAMLQSILVASDKENEKIPRYVRSNIDLVYADFYIATGREDEAVKYLRSALLTAKGKYNKTRAMFILGQIYDHQNDKPRATEQFKNVIRKHASYEITFEAKMNLARCYDADTTTIMRMLKRMLKDVKNTEYKDRIYYAMADVALDNNNEKDGVKYLRKSVATSTNNNMQKIKSSLDVANILFDNSDYILSQAYFDTAVMTMDRNYPGYDSLLNLSVMLTDLVSNLTVYKTQDSLLRLADMDSIHRNAIIDQIIEEYKEEQKRLEEQREIEKQIALNGGNEKPEDMNATTNDGNWYFYNNITRNRGANDFKNKWGNRMLEDYWFISNKQSFVQQEQEELEMLSEEELAKMSDEEREKYLQGLEISKDTTQYTPLDRGYYLKQIPFTQQAKDQANQQIAEALNNIGFIYYSDLQDYPRSIEAYTELSNRYPDNPNEVSAWYYLYKMHSIRKETDNSDKYKNLVLTKYPDSNQAKIILDPDYFVKEHEKGAEAEQLYAKTFEAYESGQYQRVMMNVKKARQQFADDTLYMPRFEFLNAVSLGYVEVVDSMAYSLLRLIKKYPESSIKPFALDVLLKANDMYNLGLNIESARPKEEQVVEKESPYTFRPNDEYYVLVICNKKVRINPLKVRIGDFNKNNFRMDQLKVKNMMLNKEDALITIEKFENVDKALDYQAAMFLTDYIFGGIDKENYKVIIISISNYPIFYQEKNVDEYLDFWYQYNK
ncbi:MAG: tetratricopeptide repeat protein [Bacteroidales bacterium]|nr:tetratricopeptide repeat protein [Bacteroidales bacterium]